MKQIETFERFPKNLEFNYFHRNFFSYNVESDFVFNSKFLGERTMLVTLFSVCWCFVCSIVCAFR